MACTSMGGSEWEGDRDMKYYHRYIENQNWEIWCHKDGQQYSIANLYWTDRLNPTSVENNAKRIAACLNYCEGIKTSLLEQGSPDGQFDKLMEKLENIRCGIIDVETAIEQG